MLHPPATKQPSIRSPNRDTHSPFCYADPKSKQWKDCCYVASSHWTGKLSPSPCFAPLSRNLDNCNQRNYQSDLQTGILIHPFVKPSVKTNNEKIVAMWPFSQWAEKLSPSPRLAPLSRNLDHCNQRCIHQPQSNHQSDLEPNIALLFFPLLPFSRLSHHAQQLCPAIRKGSILITYMY